MKNEMQIFNHPDYGDIRTVEINNAPYFVGKDVAVALGYQKPNDAINQHVDIADTVKYSIRSGGQMREVTLINESGVYSLIFSSKLPKAKEFKHWATTEVLPSIRKSGGYSIPQSAPIPIPVPRYSPLIELAKQCPNVNITLKAGELIEAIDYCVNQTRKELEQLITDANTETYPSIEQVSKILDVNKTTLWRWGKQGYLVPIEIGGKRRYKMSDINKILNKG
jgi:prophage antirepressor-like protein